jgi:hypothetical protein
LSLSSQKYGFGIRDPEKKYSGSRIQGSKRHPIPDTDPPLYVVLMESLNDFWPSADRVWFGVQGIWNLIFTLSNLALFLFLPFAYLLCESEGFIGAKVRTTRFLTIVNSQLCMSGCSNKEWLKKVECQVILHIERGFSEKCPLSQ